MTPDTEMSIVHSYRIPVEGPQWREVAGQNGTLRAQTEKMPLELSQVYFGTTQKHPLF